MPPSARVVALVAFVVSCSVDLEPPPDVTITCTSTSQCPATYRCSSQLGRCVPGGQEDVPPHILDLTALVERDVGAAPGTAVEAATVGSTVRVRFRVDEELLEAPRVRLTWPDDDTGYQREATASATASGYEMVTTIAATDPVGAVSVSVIAVDLASNVGNAELPRHFLVDTTPFLLSSVALRARSPVPTELTAIGVEVTAVRNEAPGLPEVEAQLIFSKPPRQAPVVTLEGPNGSVDGVVSALAATSFAVTFEVDDGLATAEAGDTFELAVTAYDAAGISWQPAPSVVVPVIVIDTTPPVLPSALRFLRAPWGSGSALTERTFALESTSANAVIGAPGEPDYLFVHDSAGAGRARLGFGTLQATGSLPGDRLLLATADRLEVFATLVDAAGNEGPTLRVANGRWIATFKGRSTGNDFLNPNRLTRVSEPGNALFDGLATEAATADIDKTVLADGDRFTHSVRSGVWRFRRLGSPPSQSAGGAVYVPASGKVQLIGGTGDAGAFPNLWDWDGRDWREVDLIGTLWPGENFGPSVAHDSGRNRTVYHGGTATGDPLQQTWEYDGVTWLDATPTVPGPPATFAPMVYDALAGVMVLYGALEAPVLGACPGGLPVQQLINQCLSQTTWLWDGATWEAVPCTDSACPPPRIFTSMAYDPESQRVVLFGGTNDVMGGVTYGDLWEWDTATRTWSDVTPATGLRPSPRRSSAMAYVGGLGGVLIWGGCEGGEFFDCARDLDGSDNLDTYLVWNGSAAPPNFTSVAVDTPAGLGGALVSRGLAQTVYIAARDELLLFGGARQLNTTPVASCAAFTGGCDGDDPVAKGVGPTGRCVCDYDSGWLLRPTGATIASWQRVAATSAVHSQTSSFSMVYAEAQHRTFIFGGRVDSGNCDGAADNDSSDNCHGLWSWDGIAVRPELAYDPAGPNPPTNIVDQTQCGQRNSGAPCGQTEHPGTYLPLEQHVAFFDNPERLGGGGYNRGLWRYYGGGAPYFAPVDAAATLAEAPPLTATYAIATSVIGATESIYVFGGQTNGTACAALDSRYNVPAGTTKSYGSGNSTCVSRALWRWTAGAWQLFLPALAEDHWPPPRTKTSMVAIDDGKILLYGGCTELDNNDCASSSTSVNGDTWILTPGAVPTWTCLSGTSPSCPSPPSVDPGPLNGSQLAYDGNTHRALMFGGSAAGEGPGSNSLWSWRESSGAGPLAGVWSEIVVDGVKPLNRRRHGLVYDSARNVLILAGEGRPGELWEIGLDSGNRPVMVFDFALRAAGLSEAATVVRAADTVTRLRLFADVITSAYASGVLVDGLVVQLWNSGLARWFDVGQAFDPGGSFVGTCDYDSDAALPGRQVICTLTDAEAREMVFAGDDHIYARIAPAGGIGADGEAAVLSLDAVRLEVEYALP